VTNDGSILGFPLSAGSSLGLWNSTTVRAIPTTEIPTLAIVNATATEVIYEASTTVSTHLRAVNLATGTDILIATRPGSSGTTRPSIANDGTLVAYVAEPLPGQPAQAWLAHTDGTAAQALTNSPEGVLEVLVDGLGTSVLAISGSRILSIDVPTGNIRELIGMTAQCYAGFESLIPGSILPINGTYLASSTQAAPIPLPNVLDGVQILMNGVSLPILSIAPTQVWFQVPFDLAPQSRVSVELKHSSVFEGCAAINAPVVERQPYLVTSSSGILTLAHQDFQSLVTQASPVEPGEIVHAYAVGLGIVVPAMQTGVATPLDRLFTLAEPFTCSIGTGPGGSLLNVLFAGLSPGAIGIYQVDVQMPSPLPTQEFFLNCGTPGNVLERHAGLVPVPMNQ
jgi:uncharacterized protein (TIGR03437 family)